MLALFLQGPYVQQLPDQEKFSLHGLRQNDNSCGTGQQSEVAAGVDQDLMLLSGL